jgi:outer membrane protein assembly factor BamB
MQRVVASPVVSGSMIFVPSRVNPLLALRAGGSDGGAAPEVLWSTTRGPDVPTPAVTEDYVFVLTDNGVLWCLDARSGDVVWGPERVEPSTYSASPVVADGKLYVTNEAGLTTVVEAGPEFRVLGRSSVEEYTLSSLAVAGGQLFLRTAEHLYCIAEPG